MRFEILGPVRLHDAEQAVTITAGMRGPGERGFATLKTWRIFTKSAAARNGSDP